MSQERDPLWYRFEMWRSRHPRSDVPLLILAFVVLYPVFPLILWTMVKGPEWHTIPASNAPLIWGAGTVCWLLALIVGVAYVRGERSGHD